MIKGKAWKKVTKIRLRSVEMEKGEYFWLGEWDWPRVDMKLCMAFLGELDCITLVGENDLGKGYRPNIFWIFRQWPGM